MPPIAAPAHSEAGADLLELLDDETSTPPAAGDAWRVLIVDDDDDVHRSTVLALRGLQVEGRRIEFCHAHSAASARTLIERDDEIAAILLDVVMETPDAGLQLVRQVREELNRQALRIILRTGQPGYAPELETIRSFDINDYRTKSELTQVRLFTSLTTAIRSYRQTLELTQARDEMALLAANLLEARAAELSEAERRADAEQALEDAGAQMTREVASRTQSLSTMVDELESFNRMVAHDLRGPLHGLSSIADLIREELELGQTPRAKQWLSLMATQTRRLSGLVDELLILAKAAQGPLRCHPTALGDLVQEGLQSLGLSLPAERLQAIHVGALPTVNVDAPLMRQVFVNLIGNALKFCRDAAQPRVDIAAEHRADGWVVSVRDNGVGFDAARAASLFTPFTRLHGVRFEGVGIGLAVVRRIVERHGGRVWADAAPGQGATFRFSLPEVPREAHDTP